MNFEYIRNEIEKALHISVIRNQYLHWHSINFYNSPIFFNLSLPFMKGNIRYKIWIGDFWKLLCLTCYLTITFNISWSFLFQNFFQHLDTSFSRVHKFVNVSLSKKSFSKSDLRFHPATAQSWIGSNSTFENFKQHIYSLWVTSNPWILRQHVAKWNMIMIYC